ncbi:MAG: CoA-binding protein [Chloroflexi bacterium]|nr:CoA-binding protein [Chloroflexota bacterium]
MDVVSQMKLFVEPHSIAIIGATTKTGAFSFNITDQLLTQGFKGQIYPVNPKADLILGRKAYRCIADVPERVDLALIPVWDRSAVPNLVQECVDAGVKAIIVVTQGFADGDREGGELQDRIMAIAREGGARVLGPNSLGVANAFIGLNTAFMPLKMEKLPLGLICQSGIFFPGFHTVSTLGKGIDVANGGDVQIAEALEYYEDDPETRVILLHVEGLRDGRRFLETARRVSGKKPIIALKTARSEAGARAAQSHTGSLAGSDAVFQALARQCGIVQASDIEEMEEQAKAFLRLPPMKGRRVGIVSMSGGVAVMLVDACAQYGMEVAILSPQTQARLQQLTPPWTKAANPMDFWPLKMHSRLGIVEAAETCLREFASDANIDGMVFVLGLAYGEEALNVPQVVSKVMRTSGKPICWWPGPSIRDETVVEIEKTGA